MRNFEYDGLLPSLASKNSLLYAVLCGVHGQLLEKLCLVSLRKHHSHFPLGTILNMLNFDNFIAWKIVYKMWIPFVSNKAKKKWKSDISIAGDFEVTDSEVLNDSPPLK